MSKRIMPLRIPHALFLVFSLLLLTGCSAAIPDVSSFHNATIALRDVSKSSFDETVRSVQDVKQRIPQTTVGQSTDPSTTAAAAQTLQDYDDAIDYLTKLRTTRLAVLDAMVNYAAELDRSAKAGQSEIDRVNAATKVASQVVQQVSSQIPSAGASALVAEGVSIFTDAVNRANSHFVVLKTNHTLLEQMQANESAVAELADGLDKDLQTLSNGLGPIKNAADISIRSQPSARHLYLVKSNLTAELIKIPTSQSSAIVEKQQQIAVIDAALAPVESERTAVTHQTDLAIQVIDSARTALKSWKDENTKLKDAVVAANTLTSDELNSDIKEVEDELQRFRDFRDKVVAARKPPTTAPSSN